MRAAGQAGGRTGGIGRADERMAGRTIKATMYMYICIFYMWGRHHLDNRFSRKNGELVGWSQNSVVFGGGPNNERSEPRERSEA